MPEGRRSVTAMICEAPFGVMRETLFAPLFVV